MKNILLLILTFISHHSIAQVVIESNPSYISSSERPILDEWLDVESLDGRAEPVTIVNPSEKICFDKKMLVKARVPQGVGYTCIFINTKIGLVGYTPLSKNRTFCELDVNDPDFNFNIIGLKGTHFNYYNSNENDILKHHVITKNTTSQGLITTAVASNEPIYRKDEQQEFFGKVKAWNYKATGRTESWWIFGKTIPEKLVMQPNKFLGLFGVGYQFAEQGLFIILKLSSSGTYSYEAEILELSDIPTCLNSNIFRIFEENELVEAETNLEEGQQRLNRRIQKIRESDDPCKELKEKVLKQNKKLTGIVQHMVQSMQQGRQQQNMQLQVEKEVEQQQAMVDEYDAKICKKEVQLAKTHSQSSRQILQKEKRCLQQNRDFDDQMLSRFRNIQTANRNNPTKAMKQMVQARQDFKRRPCTN